MTTKKGDLFDGYMWAAKIAQNDPYSMYVQEFPVDCQMVLKPFLNKWMLPERSIPKKDSKSFGRWVKDLKHIYELISDESKIEHIISEAYEDYKNFNFVVSNPGAIIQLIINTMGRLRREEKDKIEQYLKVVEATKPIQTMDEPVEYIAPLSVEKKIKPLSQIKQEEEDAEWLKQFTKMK